MNTITRITLSELRIGDRIAIGNRGDVAHILSVARIGDRVNGAYRLVHPDNSDTMVRFSEWEGEKTTVIR